MRCSCLSSRKKWEKVGNLAENALRQHIQPTPNVSALSCWLYGKYLRIIGERLELDRIAGWVA